MTQVRDEHEQIHWWQQGVIYHIYPRSFFDASGDGIGDLPGITRKLDYVWRLGAGAIWLSPIYPSPMADFGYDVSDYTNIHPMFGSLADFTVLLHETHCRGMKLLLDWVPNHTSDEHPWFQESRTSRASPKRDWYLWHDPAPGGGPPNNWLSAFGGSAWQWDERTNQYYYHTYHTKQPDLNWRNPDVQAAMLDVLRFWLDLGVDGFRVDALRQIIKDDLLRDNPPNPSYTPDQEPYQSLLPVYSTERPESHAIIRRIRHLLDSYGDRLLIGELYLPIERLMRYYGEEGAGIHLPTNFHLLQVPWNARDVAALVTAYEAALPVYGWPNWTLSNHDNPRVASRIGHGQGRIAMLLLLTLRGTPTLYYGDGIGMRDVPIPAEQAHDPRASIPGYGRDPERTPMQWDGTPHAGFCPPSARPWLPVADDYREVNVAVQQQHPRSMLALTRALIRLRRAHPALSIGAYRQVASADEDCFIYERRLGSQRFTIAANFADGERVVALPEGGRGQVVLSTYLDRTEPVDLQRLRLRSHEGYVIAL